jgi:hypothetical protein
VFGLETAMKNEVGWETAYGNRKSVRRHCEESGDKGQELGDDQHAWKLEQDIRCE